MTLKHTQPDFTGQHIYVGIDVGKKKWIVCIVTQFSEHKVFTQAPQVSILAKYLHRTFSGATYHCVYEAGYCGFWIQKQLQEHHIDCMVVHTINMMFLELFLNPETTVSSLIDTMVCCTRKRPVKILGQDRHLWCLGEHFMFRKLSQNTDDPFLFANVYANRDMLTGKIWLCMFECHCKPPSFVVGFWLTLKSTQLL